MMPKNSVFLKYFDSVNIILILFIILASLFLFSTNRVNDKIKNFNHYYTIVAKMKIIDNDFNNFVNTKATFMNYDVLMEKGNEILELADLLDNENFYNNFRSDFESSITVLKEKINEKLNETERFKSANALIVGNTRYLLALSDKLKINYISKSSEDLLLLDRAMYTLFRLFLRDDYSEEAKSSIKNEVSNLEKLVKKYKVQDVTFFNKQINAIVDDLFKIKKVKDDFFTLGVREILDSIDNKMEEENIKNIDDQQKLALVLLISSGILLISFIYIYIKSLKVKDELIAFKYAVENSFNSIVLTDKDRRITYVNEAFEKATGYTKKEAMGQNPRILKSGKLPDEYYIEMNDILNRGEKWIGEFVNKNKHGELFYENASITPIIINNKLKGYLAIKIDISDYIKEKQKAEFLAYHDSLTKLKNRRALQREIEKFIESDNRKFTILFIDLDGFKFINDELGHDIGDLLLKEVSNRYVEIIGTKGEVYRMGGDEFAIVLDYNSDEEIEEFAKRVIKRVNDKYEINNHPLHVGCSIGISRFPQDAKDLTSLLKHADMAMYKAKNRGKNRFEYYTQDLTSILTERFEVEQEFKDALKNNEFYIVYQPKYSLSNHNVYGVESLLKWQNKKLGDIDSSLFIHIAEEVGFIHELGNFVLRKACEDFKELQKKLGIKMLSINVSAAQLMQDNFIKDIKQIFEDTNIEPSFIGIELTESFVIQNLEEIVEKLKELKKLGVKILIDDFGTGYSSLQYLQKLPVDMIKIDKTFVNKLNRNDQDIIKAVVAISKSFGYITIAEGVETKEQEEILKELGVDLAQGFLFSQPKRLIEFI